MGPLLSWILLGVLAAMLLAACWYDLKSRTIPNRLNLAIALLAIPFWWSIGLPLWPDAAIQLGVAAAVFALFALAFALGAMGGGDVKLVGRPGAVAARAGGARPARHHVARRRRADPGDVHPPPARPQARAARNSLWGRDRIRRFVAD